MSIKVNNANKVHVSWDEVPEEYEWFAIDKNKGGNVYSEQPQIYGSENSWTFKGSGGDFTYWDYTGDAGDWKETLQQRPIKTAIAPQENTEYSVHIHLDSDIDSLTYCGKLSKEQVARIVEVIYE